MNATSSSRFSADLKNLAVIRRFVEEQMVGLGVDPEAIPSLVLAVDEAATNIIVHGYRNHGGTIEIEVGLEKGDLMIRLRDQAPLFDPTRIPPPDLTRSLEERAPGGLGVYLIRQAADEVIHRVTSEGGNELILVKRNQKPVFSEKTGF
jgi:serine/threonine-protein kinase RsbW